MAEFPLDLYLKDHLFLLIKVLLQEALLFNHFNGVSLPFSWLDLLHNLGLIKSLLVYEETLWLVRDMINSGLATRANFSQDKKFLEILDSDNPLVQRLDPPSKGLVEKILGVCVTTRAAFVII